MAEYANLEAARARAKALGDTISWNATNPAALGVATEVLWTNDNGGFFEIDYVQFTAWPVAVIGGSPAYTELIEAAHQTGASNTNYSYAGLRAKVETDQTKYFRTYTRVRHFAGNARNWFPLQRKWIVPPGGYLRVSLQNDLAVAVYADMSFIGSLIPPP